MTAREAMKLKPGVVVVWVNKTRDGRIKFRRAPVHQVVPWRAADGRLAVSVQVQTEPRTIVGLEHGDIRKTGRQGE